MSISNFFVNNRFLFHLTRNVIHFFYFRKVTHFVRKIKGHESKFIAKLEKDRTIVHISKLRYDYQAWSAFYFDNALALSLEALMKKQLPILSVETIKDGKIILGWNQFFSSTPFSELTQINEGKEVSQKKTNSLCRPLFSSIYNKKEIEIWGYCYHLFDLSSDIKPYIAAEEKILANKKVLGVICRGTDYISLKPKYHPIQPNVEDVINEANELLKSGAYDFIYLATEDQKIKDKFVSFFGKDKILLNKRQYYDKKYFELDKGSMDFSVHFNRDNDDFLKGLEYLSSLIILSKCDSLIGGNCGGLCFR